MYAFKILSFSAFMLLAAISLKAQEEDESEYINPPKIDSAATEYEEAQQFDFTGKNVGGDSAVVMAADTIFKADTTTALPGKKHTAAKAVWLSALVPGLGQAYNKKYWKIPIIYAGFGGLAYALYYTNNNFNIARDAYRKVVRGQYATYLGYTSPEDLKYFRDTYKNFLNLSALFTIIWYGINLIDAAVDGHLYSYNMDDKLSINLSPLTPQPNALGLSQPSLGLSLTFALKAKTYNRQVLKAF